jgi:hypothetical protein
MTGYALFTHPAQAKAPLKPVVLNLGIENKLAGGDSDGSGEIPSHLWIAQEEMRTRNRV